MFRRTCRESGLAHPALLSLALLPVLLATAFGPGRSASGAALASGYGSGFAALGAPDTSHATALVERFAAIAGDRGTYLAWETGWERGTAGFYLYRQTEGGSPVQVTAGLLPALYTFEQGGVYRLFDPGGAQTGQVYSYRLEEVGRQGDRRSYGPVRVAAEAPPALSPLSFPADLTERYASPAGEVVYQRMPHGVQQRMPAVELSAQSTGAVPLDWGRVAGPTAAYADYRVSLPLIARGYVAEPPLGSVGTARFTVKTSGLYYLAADDIASTLGLTRAQVVSLITNRHLQISNQGQDVAVLPADDSSGLYLYGQESHSSYTWDNVYWLRAGSAVIMASQVTGPASSPVPNSIFSDTVYARERRGAPVTAFDDPSSDYWTWDYVAISGTHSSRSFPMHSDDLAGSGSALLKAHFVGYTTSYTDKDYFAQVQVNGTQVGEVHWTGHAPYTLTLPFSAALLVDGANTITVTARPEPGVPVSMFYIQSFDLSYPRHYYAVADQMIVRGDANPVVTVSRFTTSTVRAFDIANPWQPQWVQNVQVGAANGAYQATFVPQAADHPYLLLTAGKATRVSTLARYTPANLKTVRPGADYVIITTAALSSTARSLAGYRQGQGLRPMVIDSQNIYDEFNYGLAGPQAIQAFLGWAYRYWTPVPRYVLLAGSGSYDYKNYLQSPVNPNLIPPLMIDTPFGLVSTDVPYGAILGHTAPDIAVGRLPVATAAELQADISKIQAYEAGNVGSWLKHVLMLADIPDPVAGDFVADSDHLAAFVPGGYNIQKIYRQSFPLDPAAQAAADKAAHQAVTSTIRSGVGLVNFVGHGGLDRLTAPGLLVNNDVARLANGAMLPIFNAPTCVVGAYGVPGYDALGKLLVNQPDGGGIAVWAPSGPSFNDAAVALDGLLFQAFFGGTAQRAGDASLQAWQGYAATTYPRFNADIYQFLGDPALLLKQP